MDDELKAIHRDQETLSRAHTQLVLVDNYDDGTAVVTLNRPQKHNALSAALIAELTTAFRVLELNDSVRAIVLTGSPGGPFSGKLRTFSNLGREIIGNFRHSGCRSWRTQAYFHIRSLQDPVP